MWRLSYYLVFAFVLITCSARPTFDHGYFFIGISNGILDNPEIDEASGLAASVRNNGMLWTHNDSGDKARIFLIDEKARHQATITIGNIENRDWEDIAVGPGPKEGVPYVFIADIGDNFARHEFKYIYRLEEPSISNNFGPLEFTLSEVDSIKFSLPDGPRDAEALMVDPQTRNIYIFSKREKKQVNLYVLPYPQSTTEVMTAQFVMHIPFTQINAADISEDGREVLIKNYSNVYYWRKHQDEPIEELLKKQPFRLPYATEPQGEAVTFQRKGDGYFTLSEAANKKKPHLMFYKRKK